MDISDKNLETLRLRFQKPVARIILNRPEVRNAMNQKMVAELIGVFAKLRNNRECRVIVLSGAGGVFCAGGDIKEMRDPHIDQISGRGIADNLDTMLRACNEAPQVIIAKIEGAALGGGLGLVCCTDIAIATEDARFGMPEVRLGVAPSLISPFVIQRIGLTRARELMLTGRYFNGIAAKQYGIVTTTCSPDRIDNTIRQTIDEILLCSANAIAATKEIIFTVMHKTPEETAAYRAEMLNKLREGSDAQEGLTAFLEKRPPRWSTANDETS